MPADVTLSLSKGLKEIAPTLGFTAYQPLMRSPGSPDSLLTGVVYISQALRRDLSRLDGVQYQYMLYRLLSGHSLHLAFTGSVGGEDVVEACWRAGAAC